MADGDGLDLRPRGALLSRSFFGRSSGGVGRGFASGGGGVTGGSGRIGRGFASGGSGIASGFSSVGRCRGGFLSGFHRSLFLLGASSERQGHRQRGENHFRVHVIDHPNVMIG